MRIPVAILAAASLFLSGGNALAWDGQKTATVNQYHVVTDGQNYGFRVYLDGVASMCGTADAWGYVNRGADNYDAVVSAITSALLAGKTVVVYSNKDAGLHCAIGYVVVNK